ncbi:cytochrome c biogenesis protein ResB [Angustibacter aerolatus]
MTQQLERETPAAPVQPKLGLVGSLRFAWRQLTSMRTALFLLLLLAVAAVPGSVLPQRGVNPGAVTTYLRQHPTSGPWIDRLGGFDVYASVWFSAIYLLLFVSLIGCVLPRTRVHLRSLRAKPPRTPARLDRLPAHASAEVDGDADQVLAAVAESLRRRRFRVDTGDGTVSAERGYLRETGNLVFHVSLVVLLGSVAAGHLLGWRGDVVVPVGDSFSNTSTLYDALDTGPWVDREALPPFSLTMDSLTVEFDEQATGSQRGAPREFRGEVTVRDTPTSTPRRSALSVNHPVSVDGAKVFLLGNGYAPVVTVRDAKGAVLFQQPVVFPPTDGNYNSSGVVQVTGATPKQIAFAGSFLPTAVVRQGTPTSVFPDTKNPVLLLTAYEGTIGNPASVYTLDTSTMTQLTDGDQPFSVAMSPGQTEQLPGGRGSITFDRVQRFAGLSIRHDPAKGWALWSAVAAMLGLGLSLFVPRRRVFARVRSVGPRTLVDVGALARGEDAGLDDELARALEAAGHSREERT